MAELYFLFVVKWGWLLPALLLLLWLCEHQNETRSSGLWRLSLIAACIVVIVIMAARYLRILYLNVSELPQWDFAAFWIPGQIAAQGLDFYDPQNYQLFAREARYTQSFIEQILNVGFWYPPPTIFLFLLLGYFEQQPASLLWHIALGVSLLISIGLLWRILFRASGWVGGLWVCALVLLFQPVLDTLIVSQTNFMVFSVCLWAWQERSSPRSGFWLAVGALIKPYCAILFIHLLVRRRMRACLSALATFLAAALITLLRFGPGVFLSYANVPARLPSYVNTEQMNQSLLATTLRATQADVHNIAVASLLNQPIYIALALALTTLTLGLIYALNAEHDDLSLILTLLLALLIYPQTLIHYGVMLLLPMLFVWTKRAAYALNFPSVAAYITLTYLLTSNLLDRNVFAAIALNWLVLAAIGFRLILKRKLQVNAVNLSINSCLNGL